MERPVQVIGDSSGRYLVALVGPEADRLWWPAWCITDGNADGPRSLGNWIRFIPSDWRPFEGPLPEHVRRVVEWVASIEDLNQVGIRNGRGWMPRAGAAQPPPIGRERLAMVSDKFAWGPGDVVLSQCAFCKHLADGPGAVCAAFPGAIPVEILHNEVDHRKAWIDPDTGQPGDMGIPLERSITFEPRDSIHPAALAALYRYLDQFGGTNDETRRTAAGGQ